MKISNPSNLPLIDYRTVEPLQGKLKDLTQNNYAKLKGVLDKRGFTVPLFIWRTRDGKDYLMDGHQRQRVMIKEDMQPYEVPYVLVEAETVQDAKAQLLEITSQYGTITQEGFDEFIVDLPEAEIMEAVNFDALNWKDPETEVEEDEPPEVDETVTVSKLGEIYQLGRWVYCTACKVKHRLN